MAKITVSVVIGGFIVLLMQLYNLLVLKPKLLRAKLRRQGIRGPSPSFFFGNIPEMKRIQLQVHATPKTTATKEYDHPDAIAHDWPSTIFPHLEQWRNEYGTSLAISSLSLPKQVEIQFRELKMKIGRQQQQSFFFWQKDNSSSHRGYSSDFRQFLLSEYSNCNQSYKPLQSILMKIGVLFVFVALLSFSNKSIIQEKKILVLFRQVNLDMDWEWELQQISFE